MANLETVGLEKKSQPKGPFRTKNAIGRRTEQAKANLDPRVGPRVAPRVGPRVDPRVRPRDRPRERPRQHPRGLISLFSALQGLPQKLPRNVPRRRPRKCPRKCPVKWSRFTCPVFTSFCSSASYRDGNCSSLLPQFPYGPKDQKKIVISSEIENFERE